MSTLTSITKNDLRQVLEASRMAHPIPITPLHALATFQHYLFKQVFGIESLSGAIIDTLLVEWLNTIIQSELTQRRKNFDLHPPQNRRSLPEALTDLQSDFMQESCELEAWSLLYHRYVRVDLELAIAQLERTTAQNKRTLRRRQERGLRRLLHVIIVEEIAFHHNPAA
jgi:hypothetical protein